MTEQTNNHLPVWAIEEKYPGMVKIVREAMEQVIDPELGLNMIELGMIRNVEYLEDEGQDEVKITMILTTPFCPYGPMLIQQVEQAAETVLMRMVTVELGDEMWDPSMMQEGLGEWGLY
ncbi:MAG: DUF59 domain-containing protein [Anaerolineaceae bacterium]|nr:DUF59 domain-containing protein [Anaerolineaceae bacterium]